MISIQCVECGDRCQVSTEGLVRIRHWHWREDGRWITFGWDYGQERPTSVVG